MDRKDKVEVRCGKCEAAYSIDLSGILLVIEDEIGITVSRLGERIRKNLLEAFSSAEKSEGGQGGK